MGSCPSPTRCCTAGSTSAPNTATSSMRPALRWRLHALSAGAGPRSSCWSSRFGLTVDQSIAAAIIGAANILLLWLVFAADRRDADRRCWLQGRVHVRERPLVAAGEGTVWLFAHLTAGAWRSPRSSWRCTGRVPSWPVPARARRSLARAVGLTMPLYLASTDDGRSTGHRSSPRSRSCRSSRSPGRFRDPGRRDDGVQRGAFRRPGRVQATCSTPARAS